MKQVVRKCFGNKIISTTVVMVAATVSAFGQGVVVFGNRDLAQGIDAIITDGGVPVAGTAGWAALLFGPAGTGKGYALTPTGVTVGNLTQLGSAVNFRTGAAAGYILPDSRAVPGVAAGQPAMLQMVAWTGNSADWWSALTAAMGDASIHVGASATWTVTTSDHISPILPVNTGLSAFSLVPFPPIPEPRTMALAGLGAVLAFVLRWGLNPRRRRESRLGNARVSDGLPSVS